MKFILAFAFLLFISVGLTQIPKKPDLKGVISCDLCKFGVFMVNTLIKENRSKEGNLKIPIIHLPFLIE